MAFQCWGRQCECPHCGANPEMAGGPFALLRAGGDAGDAVPAANWETRLRILTLAALTGRRRALTGVAGGERRDAGNGRYGARDRAA